MYEQPIAELVKFEPEENIMSGEGLEGEMGNMSGNTGVEGGW